MAKIFWFVVLSNLIFAVCDGNLTLSYALFSDASNKEVANVLEASHVKIFCTDSEIENCVNQIINYKLMDYEGNQKREEFGICYRRNQIMWKIPILRFERDAACFYCFRSDQKSKDCVKIEFGDIFTFQSTSPSGQAVKNGPVPWIIGVAVGGAVALTVIFVVVLWCSHRYKRCCFQEEYTNKKSFPADLENGTKPDTKLRATSETAVITTAMENPLFIGTEIDIDSDTVPTIPPIVEKCVNTIRQYGLEVQELFRVAEAASRLPAFKISFEKDDYSTAAPSSSDIKAIASLTTRFFYDMERKLFPFDLLEEYVALIRIGASEKEMITKVKEFVETLPKRRQVLASYLFLFLKEVSVHSKANLMDSYNLAVCFYPVLVEIPETLSIFFAYSKPAVNMIKIMIDNDESIFGGIDY